MADGVGVGQWLVGIRHTFVVNALFRKAIGTKWMGGKRRFKEEGSRFNGGELGQSGSFQ